MHLHKLMPVLVLIFVLSMIIQNPSGAAHQAADVADSFGTFLMTLAGDSFGK